jgi:CDP-diacylglycerol--glycerol-3-phosphate 3-phosphatidyltransferase
MRPARFLRDNGDPTHTRQKRGSGVVEAERETFLRLRRQWLLVAALYGGALLAGYAIVAGAWTAGQAARWSAPAAAALAVQMAILWWALPRNRPAGGAAPFATLGPGNGLTLARGALLGLLAGFLFAPAPPPALAWAPAILYSLERALDFCDGYVARVTGRETELGEVLDMEFDGLGVLIVTALAIQMGHLPAWYLLLGVTRPLFVAGAWLRRRQGKPVYDLPPSDYRRLIAGMQTVFLSVALWPVWEPAVMRLAGTLFALPLIFSFARDWLAVSGALDAESPGYARARRQAKALVEGWLPLFVRAGAALLAAALVWRAGETLPRVLALLLLACALLLLAGCLGRAAALVLLFAAAAHASAAGLEWGGNALLMVGAAFVLHAGSGHFALWKPEERLLRAKAGAPPATHRTGIPANN